MKKPFFVLIVVIFQAHVYSAKTGDCAAFLSNYDVKSAAKVLFNDKHYNLPPWSISILSDCKNVVFNTAKVYKNQATFLCVYAPLSILRGLISTQGQ